MRPLHSLQNNTFLLMIFLFTSCLPLSRPSMDSHYVEINGPDAVVRPLSPINREASLAVLPFHVPANMDREQGGRIGMLFKDTFLQKQLFRTVFFLDGKYGDIEEALQYGRQERVDFILAGKVNYAFHGTEFGGSRIDVAIRLLNVHTGNTIWYLNEAMDEPVDYPDLRFSARFASAFSPNPIRRSQGPPALSVMLAQIASEMADKMCDY